MYIHSFLFQWHPSVTSEMKDRAAREIRALQGQIPGLLETSYGANVSPRSQGFAHGGVMKFRDKAALYAYSPQPLLQKLVGWMRRLRIKGALTPNFLPPAVGESLRAR